MHLSTRPSIEKKSFENEIIYSKGKGGRLMQFDLDVTTQKYYIYAYV